MPTYIFESPVYADICLEYQVKNLDIAIEEVICHLEIMYPGSSFFALIIDTIKHEITFVDSIGGFNLPLTYRQK